MAYNMRRASPLSSYPSLEKCLIIGPTNCGLYFDLGILIFAVLVKIVQIHPISNLPGALLFLFVTESQQN